MKYATVTALCLFILAGCAGNNAEKITEPERPLRLNHLSLVMPAQSNENWPARVDLVRVTDVALANHLLSIETRAWFKKSREAFRQAHPEVFFDSWEVVPGTVVGPLDVGVTRPVAGVLFCGTLASRSVPPPVRFERDGDVAVRIDDEGCTLSGGKPSKKPFPLNKLKKPFLWLFED